MSKSKDLQSNDSSRFMIDFSFTAAILKACEGLAVEGKIKEKAYGKQKVYVADQSQYPEVNNVEIKSMDSSMVKLTEKLQANMEEIKQLDSDLKTFSSCLSTADAKKQLAEILFQCKKYKEKLKQLKEGCKVISPQEKDKTSDRLNAILEGYPKPKKQLYEEISIETDEENRVKLLDL